MRKNFGAKPFLYPQPVLIISSYDENGVPDAMNAAWGGISESDQISMCLSPGHKTVKNILGGVRSRDNIWNVNTEKEYLEGK